MKNIRLSQWAKINGYSYRGAYNAYVSGNIPNSYSLPSGTIMIRCEEAEKVKSEKVAIYARVSSPKQKNDLTTQAKRLSDFCVSNGWQISVIKKEIASGLNDNRKMLNDLLDDHSLTKIIVEHKDRLSRFGFNYIERLLRQRGCEIVVVNKVEDDKEDLMQDFVSIITSMVARLYGLRKSKRKTEELIRKMTQ
jgi:predicted site-specific integrase-resolvase